MSLPVLFPLLLTSAMPQQYSESRPSDPRVQVWLSSDAEYERGDRARVWVRAAEDGYLVVLHADAQRRVRILFPLDPADDDFVRGGASLEMRARGDRDAFLIEERTGTGLVLAAWSRDPFRFDAFVRGDHWDYRAITPDGVGENAEAGLLDIVEAMAAGSDFDYDAAPYLVGRPRVAGAVHVSIGTYPWCVGWACSPWGYYRRPGFYLSLSFATFGFRSAFCDPWYYDPFYYDAFACDPFFRFHYPIWYRPVWYHPVYIPVIHRGIWAFDPYRWLHGPRFGRPGLSIRLRYAAGSWCWDDPFCHDDPYWRFRSGPGRPGLATGHLRDGDGWWINGGEPRGGIGIRYAFGRDGSSRGGQPQRRTVALTEPLAPDRGRTVQRLTGGQQTELSEPRPSGRIASRVVEPRQTGQSEVVLSEPRSRARNETRLAEPRNPGRSEIVLTEPRSRVRTETGPVNSRPNGRNQLELSEPRTTGRSSRVARAVPDEPTARSEPIRQRSLPDIVRREAEPRASSEPIRQRSIPDIVRREAEPRASSEPINRSSASRSLREAVAPDRDRSAVSRSSRASGMSSRSEVRTQSFPSARSSLADRGAPSMRSSPPGRSAPSARPSTPSRSGIARAMGSAPSRSAPSGGSSRGGIARARAR